MNNDIILAYKKLKAYVYNSNFSLDLRIKLAEFEQNSLSNLNKLAKKIENYKKNENNPDFNEYLKKIDYILLPKKFQSQSEKNNENGLFYFNNLNKRDSYILEKFNIFIDCPIELHIISTLWVMRIGSILDKELTEHCYGNRLDVNLNENNKENSIKLFQKYYEAYNDWRDNGIKKAKELHKLNLDVGILMLDIKEYYYSIDFQFSSLNEKFKDYQYFNSLMDRIHSNYLKKLQEDKLDSIIEKNGINFLPIGLISSGIIANYYLKDFDNEIFENIKPEFYGRYVDDIMIVFSNPKIKTKEEADNFIVDTFKALKKIEVKRNENNYIIKLDSKNSLEFQNSKVKIYYFLKSESIDILEEFEKNIQKNSSEFNFQTEDSYIFNRFDTSFQKITYSDTVNKLRSIDSMTIDKLEISKYLSRIIHTINSINNLENDKSKFIDSKFNTIFSGQNALELYNLWEKLFTYFVIKNSKNKLIETTKKLIKLIKQIKYSNSNIEIINNKIQNNLIIHLKNSISLALSLNINMIDEEFINSFKDEVYKLEDSNIKQENLFKEVKDIAINLIESNLFRHRYINFPLINYCDFNNINIDKYSIIDKKIFIKIKDKDGSFIKLLIDEKKKVKYSPRFIHYHELLIFYKICYINDLLDDKEKKSYEKNESFFILNKYIKFNYLNKDEYNKNYPIEKDNSEVSEVIKKYIDNNSKINKIKIAIANIKVNINDSIGSMLNIPNLEFKKLNNLNHILNLSLKEKCHILVFPETSIPFEWLHIITDFSKRNDIAIVFGLEHISNLKKEVFNYTTTILPFKYKHYKNAFVDLRLKLDYSPNEVIEIEGRNYIVPTTFQKKEKLRLFSWKKAFFGVFNCFELTDIYKRAKYKGEVDFIIAIEYNQDTNYFSNIVESVARDIHSFVIQVNSSDFGDSRITQPTETYKKDITKIKGGDNATIITGNINIDSIRDFQSLNYILQKKEKNKFKLTPPNFNITEERKKF